MKLSTFIFHVESRKEEAFRNIVADYFKHYYPDAQKKGTLTLTHSRLVISTYDFEWMWSEVSCFVDCVLHTAKERNILVVCENVHF